MGLPPNCPNSCSLGTTAPVEEWGGKTESYGGYLTKTQCIFLSLLSLSLISPHIPLPTTYGSSQPQLSSPHFYTLLPQISLPTPASRTWNTWEDVCSLAHTYVRTYTFHLLTPENLLYSTPHDTLEPTSSLHPYPVNPPPPSKLLTLSTLLFSSLSPLPPPTSVGLYNGPQLLLGWRLTHKHTTTVSGTSAESHFIKLVPAFITVTTKGNKLGC